MSQRQRAQLKLQLMKAERLAAETGDTTDVERIKAELQEIEQQLGVASGSPNPSGSPGVASPITSPRQNEPVDSHTEKLKTDLDNVQKLHITKDKEIEDLKQALALREQELSNLSKLKADVSEKELLLKELDSKLTKLASERDEKMSTLKASQDKEALAALLEPATKEQEEIKGAISQLAEEKKHKILELKVLREEKRKFKRLNIQKEDLEERVQIADERIAQLQQERHELTEQLDEMIKKREEETAPAPPPPKPAKERVESPAKLQKMAELASLYEKILSARQSAHGSNLKPVVLKWLGADAPYVILYGDFAGENFSVPHLMKCDSEKVWTSTLYLPPGTYHYKFNINGEDKVEESLPREGSNNVIVVQ